MKNKIIKINNKEQLMIENILLFEIGYADTQDRYKQLYDMLKAVKKDAVQEYTNPNSIIVRLSKEQAKLLSNILKDNLSYINTDDLKKEVKQIDKRLRGNILDKLKDKLNIAKEDILKSIKNIINKIDKSIKKEITK